MNIKKIIQRIFHNYRFNSYYCFIFKNINFFKKMYFSAILILTKDLQIKSIIIADDAIGYIYDITKKFNIRNNPKVFNSDIQPDPSWVFLNTSKPKSDEYLFLLNYVENQKYLLKKKEIFLSIKI